MALSTWRIILRSYACDTCGAGPGEPCMTPSGHQTAEHVSRYDQLNRCPRCGAMLAADAPPGTYCDRCQLLRDLNTERAHYHRRRH